MKFKSIVKKLWIYINPFLNFKLLLIYIPIWFLMSGWTYLFIFLGMKYQINWMLISGSTWAGVLWLPCTPEKIITIPLTLLLYTKIFGNKNTKTIEKLNKMHIQAKADLQSFKIHFDKFKKDLFVIKTPVIKLNIIILTLMIVMCIIVLK